MGYKIYKFKYAWLCVVDNQYFANVITFVKSKFDLEILDNSIICIAGNYIDLIPQLRKSYPTKEIIVYNWEQLCGGNKWVDVSLLCRGMQLADEIWDYNNLNTAYLAMYWNITVAHIFPFEYVPELEEIQSSDNPEIDILFCGLINDRRANIISNLKESLNNNISIVTLMGFPVKKMNEYIANSKIVLNIHAFEPYSRQEQERIGFLLANKKCVLSEITQENYFGKAIIECPVDKIAANINNLLIDNKWEKTGLKGYKLFKNKKCRIIINNDNILQVNK